MFLIFLTPEKELGDDILPWVCAQAASVSLLKLSKSLKSASGQSDNRLNRDLLDVQHVPMQSFYFKLFYPTHLLYMQYDRNRFNSWYTLQSSVAL